MTAPKVCKDCRREGALTRRPATKPGPRCATHHRVAVKAAKQRAHGKHVERSFGITADEYAALYESQGGRCFVCQRASGAARRLAVDHDHRLGCGHPPETGCRQCVRCLACKTCNRIILGRYSPEALARALVVLSNNPPARKVLK